MTQRANLVLSVGIDVSKQTLDVAFYPERSAQQYANDRQGIAALIESLAPLQPRYVIVEATGKYEQALVVALAGVGLPVVLINPRQARDFAKALGKLAKTDRIDAAVLARFGEAVRPEIRAIVDQKTRQLQELVERRQQLVEMRTGEQNRLRIDPSPQVRRSLQAVLKLIERQIVHLDAQIDQRIRDCPEWRQTEELLKSVPGVGVQTARTLIAQLPELGTCSRQKIAALVGVAPLNRDSGQFRGRRMIWGGRRSVRRCLYMASLTATKHNSVIEGHYRKLLDAGKRKKVALVACMRKLLTILNAMLRKRAAWKNILQTA